MQFENTSWKRPDRRPLNADTWRHRIAAARSPAMTHIVSDLAFATAGMYPDLLWPLIDHVNSRDATEEPSPGRRASERNWNRMSHLHGVLAGLPDGAGTRRVWAAEQSNGADIRQGSQQRRPSVGVSETWRLLRLWRRVRNFLRRSVPASIASLAPLPATLWSRVLREREMRPTRAASETPDDRTPKDIRLRRRGRLNARETSDGE